MTLRASLRGELIEFITPDKLVLHGFLQQPARKTRTCIVYVHGMGGNFYRHELPFEIAEQSLRQNIAFFSMNTRGHDNVAKFYGNGKKLKIGTDLERFEDCVKDIAGALRALKSRGFRSFVLVGHSTGCQKITYYQYKTKGTAVKALVLLAPADDYNLQRKRLGKKFASVVKKCKALVRKGKGDEPTASTDGFSAQRFLSVADTGRVEARLFNYDGPLKEFSSITTPVFAVFGSKEEHKVKPVKTYLNILQEKTSSRNFAKHIVPDAEHNFLKEGKQVGSAMMRWLKGEVR